MITLKALVCDFDGSLAHDASGLRARDALAQARRANVRIILVTGRTFFELTRVCDCLELFDAVVAENGAVLYYPASGILSEEEPGPPDAVRRELDRRGVAYQLGHVGVSATRGDEAAVRAALAAAQVNLDVVYNHAHRGDFSQWVRGVFGDHDLARQLGKVEARWRRRELDDLRASIAALIDARYGDDELPGAHQAHAPEAAP